MRYLIPSPRATRQTYLAKERWAIISLQSAKMMEVWGKASNRMLPMANDCIPREGNGFPISRPEYHGWWKKRTVCLIREEGLP